ncbi:uncharacterized [Tachysurus ichikawai]
MMATRDDPDVLFQTKHLMKICGFSFIVTSLHLPNGAPGWIPRNHLIDLVTHPQRFLKVTGSCLGFLAPGSDLLVVFQLSSVFINEVLLVSC